eukprot:COSAG01_NODE_54364_length_332_cov_1.133047_2_plen_42_part_01
MATFKLKELCKKTGLSQEGGKPAMVERMMEYRRDPEAGKAKI